MTYKVSFAANTTGQLLTTPTGECTMLSSHLHTKCTIIVTSFLVIFISLCSLSYAQNFYIRKGGGVHIGDNNHTKQCNGTTDVDYSEISAPNCAWNHPFEALPPGGAPRFNSGDTLTIGHGSYRMGYTPGLYDSANGYSVCNTISSTSCIPSDIPAGIDEAHPTTIIGESWDTKTTPPPELWGFRTYSVLMLGRPSHGNIVLRYLELTDHEECGTNWLQGLEKDNPRWCDKNSLTNGYAMYGVMGHGLQNINEDVSFIDLNVHGLASTGYEVCGFGDGTFVGGSVKGNATGGIYLESPNNIPDAERDFVGVLTFDNISLQWNGCIENYPVSYPPHDRNCYGQEGGGDGDGLGTATMKHDVILRNSIMTNNVADGFDFLHARSERHTTAENNYFAHNGGNSLKITGPMTARNNIFIGDCDFFVGKPYSLLKIAGGSTINTCRGNGNPLVNKNPHSEIINNTFITTSSNNLYVLADTPAKDYDSKWDSQYVTVKNNIFIGEDYWDGSSMPSAYYGIDMPSGFTKTMDHNLLFNVKDIATNCHTANGDLCGSIQNCDFSNSITCGEDPLIFAHGSFYTQEKRVNSTRSYYYDMRIKPTSPAYRAGLGASHLVNTSSVPTKDYLGTLRNNVNATFGVYEEPSSTPKIEQMRSL